MINNRQNGRNNRRGRNNTRPPMGGGGQGQRPDAGNRVDSRQRGNAHQLHEKYKNLARDAQTQGDRVTAEYYLQFADHYFRVLNEHRVRQEEQRERQRQFEPRYEEGDDEGEMAEDDATAPISISGLPPAIGAAAPQNGYDDAAVDAGDDAPRRDRGMRTPERNRSVVENEMDNGEGEERAPRRRGRRPASAVADQEEKVESAPAEQPAADEAPAPRRRGRRPRQVEGMAADADA